MPEEKPCQQVQRHHPKRALHRLAKAGQQGIRERAGNGHGSRPYAGKSQQPGQGEDASGKDCQVHPGHHQQVKGAGAFKPYPGPVIQVGPIAQNHGAEHARIGVVEQQPSWPP